MDRNLSEKSNLSEQNKNRSDFGLRIYEKIKIFVFKNRKLNTDYLKKDTELKTSLLKTKKQNIRINNLKSKAEDMITILQKQLNELENENKSNYQFIEMEMKK